MIPRQHTPDGTCIQWRTVSRLRDVLLSFAMIALAACIGPVMRLVFWVQDREWRTVERARWAFWAWIIVFDLMVGMAVWYTLR